MKECCKHNRMDIIELHNEIVKEICTVCGEIHHSPPEEPELESQTIKFNNKK
jgi:hypothetical protein